MTEINKLVWNPPTISNGDAAADTPIGEYYIAADCINAGGKCYLWLAGQGDDEDHHAEFSSKAAAQAYAQADYNKLVAHMPSGDATDKAHPAGWRVVSRVTGGVDLRPVPPVDRDKWWWEPIYALGLPIT